MFLIITKKVLRLELFKTNTDISNHPRGVDFFPAAGSPSLHNSREHTSPNFLSISVNTNPMSVCGSPIREFSSPGPQAIESHHYCIHTLTLTTKILVFIFGYRKL